MLKNIKISIRLKELIYYLIYKNGNNDKIIIIALLRFIRTYIRLFNTYFYLLL